MERVKNFNKDSNPTFLTQMKSGMVFLGNTQFLPGYCVLAADPQVESLNDLDAGRRADFLLDMARLGDAIMAVCHPSRINYGILGNSAPVLHAHLFPRYDWEKEERKTRNVWTYPEEYWTNTCHLFDPARHAGLMQQLREVLQN